MDARDVTRLSKLALKRLNATADDDERWSFLFRTEGAVDFLYCPYSETEDWDFDGELEGLILPWSPERLSLIKEGKADPNEDELDQWRRAKCRKLAGGSDWSRPAWIVPITIRREVAGYALFLCNAADDSDPYLEGVFDSLQDAKAALMAEGEMVEEK
jgi:hypothetical protein